MIGVPKKWGGGFGHRYRCTQGEGYLKMKADTWVNESSISLGKSQIPSKPPKATRDTEQLPPHSFADILISDLLPPGR